MGRPNPSAVAPRLIDVMRGFYIRYNTLGPLLVEGFRNTAMATANECNVYIDINSMIDSAMSSPTTMEHHYEFAISVLNMVAHYRAIIRGRNFEVEPFFYLIYSDMSNDTLHPELRSKMTSGANNRDVIDQSIKLLNLICKYLPNCKIIMGSADTSLMIYNNIKRFEADKIPNIIISKDPMCFQLPVCTDSIVLRPKKSKGEDTSYVVNIFNAIYHTAKGTRDLAETNATRLHAIPPSLWNLVVALKGMPDGQGLTLPKTLNMIEKLLANHQIGTLFNEGLIKVIPEFEEQFPTNPSQKISDIMMNNIQYDVQYRWIKYSKTAEGQDVTWNVTLKDENYSQLRQLNDKVFGIEPVDFMGILN